MRFPCRQQSCGSSTADHLYMSQEDAVGLFLAVDAERDILHAAALACGLRSVNLQSSAFSPIQHAHVSVGMAIFRQDGETVEDLLKSADFKMYLAKHDAHANPQPQQPPKTEAHRSSPLRDLILRTRL